MRKRTFILGVVIGSSGNQLPAVFQSSMREKPKPLETEQTGENSKGFEDPLLNELIDYLKKECLDDYSSMAGKRVCE